MTMKIKPNSKNLARRDLLKILSVGGVAISAKSLPEKWARPMVDSILLPAHAQMSPILPGSCTVDPVTVNIPSFAPFIVAGTTVTFSGSSTGTLVGTSFTISDTFSVGTCLDGSPITTNFTVTGAIDLSTTPDSITATITGEVLCGGVPTCTDTGTVTSVKTAGVEGATDGTYVNAEPFNFVRECCPDRLDPT